MKKLAWRSSTVLMLPLKLQETVGKGRQFHVILRAYNGGVGLRYDFPKQPGLAEVAVKRLLTEHRFSAGI